MLFLVYGIKDNMPITLPIFAIGCYDAYIQAKNQGLTNITIPDMDFLL